MLTNGQNVVVIRGPADDQLMLNTTGLPSSSVSKNSSGADAASRRAPGPPSWLLRTSLIRDLTVTGGTARQARASLCSGSSTTLAVSNLKVNLGSGLGIQADTGAHLTMDRCTVTGNSAGGLLVNGAGYDVENSVFAVNGGTTGYGVQLSAVLSGAQFSFTTIVGNPVAATCDLTNSATVRDSIVAGPVINCNLTNSFTTAPAFDPARPYHLTCARAVRRHRWSSLRTTSMTSHARRRSTAAPISSSRNGGPPEQLSDDLHDLDATVR